MTIANWLFKNVKILEEAKIESARLDCLLLLEYATLKDRAWLLANGDNKLTKEQIIKLEELISERLNNLPIAYLVGKKEFYGHSFIVTPDVLIPRPESEMFLELIKKYPPKSGQRLLDIGTGSGALAISAKLLFLSLEVYGCDVSGEALKVAQLNSKNLKADITFFKSNLLSNTKLKYDYIFANLPYVPLGYKVSPEVHKEPEIAVFADNNGLDLIFRLADQAKNHLNKNGLVFIESLIEQQDDICDYYQKTGFKIVDKAGFIQLFKNS